MSSERFPRWTEEFETIDRKAFFDWLDGGTLESAGELLGRTKSFMSEWARHLVELRDEEVEQWCDVTGIDRVTFLEGRYQSRLNSEAAEYRKRGDAAA